MAMACSAAAANLMLDPGFDQQPGVPGSPWQTRPGHRADWVEREDGQGHCARLQGENEKDMPLWLQSNLALVGGRDYMCEFSVRAEPGIRYRVYLEWNKQEGGYGRCTNAAWRTAKGGWEIIRFRFAYPEAMKPPYLVLQLQGIGEVRYDNIVVQEAVAEPFKEGCVFSSSFETGAPDWEFSGGCRVVRDTPRDGKACLQLTGLAAGDDPTAVRRGIPTRFGSRYRLTYSVRAAGGSGETTGYQFFRVFTGWDARIEDGRDFGTVAQQDGLAWQDCFGSWQTRTLEFNSPDKPAGGLNLTLQVRGPGSVCFDSLELREIDQVKPPPPFTVLLDVPHYRGSFYSGETGDVVQGVVRATQPGTARVLLRLSRAETVVELSGEAGQEVAFSLPASPGELTAEGFADGGASLGQVSQNLSLVQAEPLGRRVVPRPDGVLMVDGKTPFFPIGIWNAPADDLALAELAAAGLNLIRCEAAAVPRLEAFGLVAVPSLPNRMPADADARAKWQEKATQTIRQLAPAPNVLAYYLVDEPLWNGFPLQPLLDAYEFYREADPWHPVWLNAAPRGTVEDLARYNQACDISGVDIYPVPEGGSHSEMDDRTVSSVGKYTVKMLESVAFRKPVWMTLQGFAWKQLFDRQDPDAVFPTPQQSRFMAYDAVVHGASGIMYWGTHSIARPEYWDVLLGTIRDLASVSGILAGSPLPRAEYELTGDSFAWCAKRAILDFSQPGRTGDYLIVVNRSPEPATLVARVPWAGNQLRILAGPADEEGTQRVLPLAEGRFRDEFAPYDVRIYTTAERWPRNPPVLVPQPRTGNLQGKSLREAARFLGETKNYEGKANWIWFPGTSRNEETACVLRRVFELPAKPEQAWLIATGDDEFRLRLNGKVVVGDDQWSRATRLPVAELLAAGANLLAVEAKDSGKPPAGFLCDLHIVLPGGTELAILSDTTWRTAEKPDGDWQSPAFDDQAWQAAEILAPYGQGPWGKRLLLVPQP
ncbi:MAG: hypothetical protein RBU25_08935 [Lentisphaeria bacterium]|nr:hypothetical protein [Lentisphaeria bacterium]